MGEAIQMGIDQKVWERDDLVVTTKIFFGTKVHSKHMELQAPIYAVFHVNMCWQ